MPKSGSIEIAGTTYAWDELTYANLEEFEAQVGDLVGPNSKLPSLKGLTYIAYLALRKQQPDLTWGVVRGWPPSETWEKLNELLRLVVPFLFPSSSGSEEAEISPVN